MDWWIGKKYKKYKTKPNGKSQFYFCFQKNQKTTFTTPVSLPFALCDSENKYWPEWSNSHCISKPQIEFWTLSEYIRTYGSWQIRKRIVFVRCIQIQRAWVYLNVSFVYVYEEKFCSTSFLFLPFPTRMNPTEMHVMWVSSSRNAFNIIYTKQGPMLVVASATACMHSMVDIHWKLFLCSNSFPFPLANHLRK